VLLVSGVISTRVLAASGNAFTSAVNVATCDC
jgi:hypothetical protein